MTTVSCNSTAATTPTVPRILNDPISKKLTKSNYPLWSAQILLVIRATQLHDLLTGVEMALTKEIMTMIDSKLVKQDNPAYPAWVARDQAILGYLLLTLTCEMLIHVSSVIHSQKHGRRLLISILHNCERVLLTRASPLPLLRNITFLFLITMQRCPSSQMTW
jgi:hypothetical protein